MHTVTTTSDSGPGSLRQALADVQAGDEIQINVSGMLALVHGPLQCTTNVIIRGPGPEALTISANGTHRVFEIVSDSDVALSGLTIANGCAEHGGGILNAGTLTLISCVVAHNIATGSGGGIANMGFLTIDNVTIEHNSAHEALFTGGGIFNYRQATLAIANSSIRHNSAAGHGGGILSDGALTIEDSTLSENMAAASGGAIRQNNAVLTLNRSTLSTNTSNAGGAIWLDAEAKLIMNESTFCHNVATASSKGVRSWPHPNGGALWNNGGTVFITSSTFYNNQAERSSGAIHTKDYGHPGKTTITNSTFSGNRAREKGGVLTNAGTVIINNSTLTRNTTSGMGGAIVNSTRGKTILFGSILAGNTAQDGNDCSGVVFSQGYNLIGDATACTLKGDLATNRTGDPLLGDLRDNGGPTLTHAPLPQSPALFAIPIDTYTARTDQRGIQRPANAACCIGAVEITSFDTDALAQPQPPRVPLPALAADFGRQEPRHIPRPDPEAHFASELHDALLHDQLILYYQPIRNLYTNQVMAFEALLRWQHPTRGLLLPETIVPLARAHGLARQLDRWVLRHVIYQAAIWIAEERTMLLAINLLPESLHDDELAHELDDLLNASGVPGSQLVFELSAHHLPHDPHDLNVLETTLYTLQSLLCLVALEHLDGSVPLKLLQRVPFDMLKFHPSALQHIPHDQRATEVLQTLINLARNRGATAIACGIAHPEQLTWLQHAGCDYGQGYVFEPPLSPDEIDQVTMPDTLEELPAWLRDELTYDEPAGTAPLYYRADPLPPAEPQPFPPELSDSDAVRMAYAEEIGSIADYLDHNLSVLVVCDKLLVDYVAGHVLAASFKTPVYADNPVALDEDDDSNQSREALNEVINKLQPSQVLVLHHLDILVDNRPDWPLINSARSLAMLFYRRQRFTPTLLAFTDPSLHIPKILRDRFNVHIEIAGLHRERLPYLVTAGERDCFASFDAGQLYKHVAGFQVLQLRTALRYLSETNRPDTPNARLFAQLHPFKRDNRETIEVPDITFEQVGGYARVKEQVFEAIELITGRPVPHTPTSTPYARQAHLPPGEKESDDERELRRKLAPRGFIFYGPPGTGKTLFAKAIANALQATIQMISGPEIMSKWIGESESNLRQVFATARRNAPAVIFFDEFDSIAGRRSSFNDSGSREMNAVVSQLLTEIDGFQADQDILVIGTTNRLDMIDQALLRPSRLMPIEIDLPDYAARYQIAAIHARAFHLTLHDPHTPQNAQGTQWLELLAHQSEGFSGDELRAVLQGVARRARRGEPVDWETFHTELATVRKQHKDQHRLRLDNDDLFRL